MASPFAGPEPCSANGMGPADRNLKPRRVAYIMSRFPKLTETFVLDEILELERAGIAVEVFPLWREPAKVMHREAQPIVARAHFTPTLGLAILRDNLRWLFRRPVVYLQTLTKLAWANRASPRFLVAALAIFPKACHFAERMRALDVQHVHAHFASHPAAAAFVVGRLAEIPWSFTAHGSDLHREQSMLAEKVREARFVVAISEHNRDFILDSVGPQFDGKIRVLHCGVDTACYASGREKRSASRKDRTPTSPIEIACIGTLHEVKGQRFLLDACARLSDMGVEWRCHLIGDGPDRVSLERQASKFGMQDSVVFHGHCERERVRALLIQMDVVVAPSVPTSDGRREGIPVVLMEAGACALPLVASRLSGIPELVINGQTGLLVEPGDAEGIAQAIYRLSKDSELRRQLGDRVLKKLELEFNLENNVERLRAEFFAMDGP